MSLMLEIQLIILIITGYKISIILGNILVIIGGYFLIIPHINRFIVIFSQNEGLTNSELSNKKELLRDILIQTKKDINYFFFVQTLLLAINLIYKLCFNSYDFETLVRINVMMQSIVLPTSLVSAIEQLLCYKKSQ